MCDEGRFTYHELREQRLAAPLHDGLPTSWDRAFQAAAAKLKEAVRTRRGAMGVVLSAQHTNEDNYVLFRLAREIWQLENIYLGGKASVPERRIAQQQLGLERRNVFGFDAVLEIAAKAGVETIYRLVARGIMGDDFPCTHEPFAD
jgi:anaerobic selenocysteine-containing dehydrogenase